MLKKLMISAAVSALMVSGAFAQANPPANPPATTRRAAPISSPKFIAAQAADQWVFSKFKGTDVLGPDNAHIGDVVDMLFDKSGKVDGVVVGVGGFLGIGEKNVAIDMSAFQVVPASTGSQHHRGVERRPERHQAEGAWTKDQLKQAPDFQYYKAPARTSGTASPTHRHGAAARDPADAARRRANEHRRKESRDGRAVPVGGPDWLARQPGPPIFYGALRISERQKLLRCDLIAAVGTAR